MTHDCPLCREDGGALIRRGTQLRVIRANEAGFPAFYRVVWNAHVAEFSDLNAADRAHCMDVVVQVEQAALRAEPVQAAAVEEEAVVVAEVAEVAVEEV